jgi:hypothetical protein
VAIQCVAHVAGRTGQRVAVARAADQALTSRRGYSVERDIAYAKLPRQTLELYRPNFEIDTVTVARPSSSVTT